LCIEKGISSEVNPALCIDDPELTLKELADFAAAGGGAVCDAQPVGCGRNPETLRRLSRGSGVNVVASTGFHKLMFYPAEHWMHYFSAEQLTELFCDELERGMYAPCDAGEPGFQTDIRAGVIKAALDTEGLVQRYALLFKAAACAAVTTGAPLMVHIEQNVDPRPLAEFLEAVGVNPCQMIFCHMDRATKDLAIHREIARRGIWLEYDTIAREKYHSNEREGEIILEMVNAGYAGQLIMGLDVTRERLAAYGGEPGLSFILRRFIPLLRETGLSERYIHGFFYENPATAFSFERGCTAAHNNIS